MTQKKLTQLTHSGQKWWWLERLGVAKLVAGMELLSGEYEMPWADQWQRNLDDPNMTALLLLKTFVGVSR